MERYPITLLHLPGHAPDQLLQVCEHSAEIGRPTAEAPVLIWLPSPEVVGVWSHAEASAAAAGELSRRGGLAVGDGAVSVGASRRGRPRDPTLLEVLDPWDWGGQHAQLDLFVLGAVSIPLMPERSGGGASLPTTLPPALCDWLARCAHRCRWRIGDLVDAVGPTGTRRFELTRQACEDLLDGENPLHPWRVDSFRKVWA